MIELIRRKIVEINNEKCNGCGECIISCAEGAIRIVDGKARLVKDSYCDGLGACLSHCPMNAISIIERDSDMFDIRAVDRLDNKVTCNQIAVFNKLSYQQEEVNSTLVNWPVQLDLVPTDAFFFDNNDLLILADCVPVAYPNLHSKLLNGRPVVIGCAKFDSYDRYEEKLKEIFKVNKIRSVTVVTMEVPCCVNLRILVNCAIKDVGKAIPVIHRTVTVKGEIY